MKRILLSWSSGKDSAWALHVLRKTTAYDVVGLLTTFNHAADRVAMHAVRRSLVGQQAAAVGIPLWPVQLPWPCSNSEYDTIMALECEKASQKASPLSPSGIFSSKTCGLTARNSSRDPGSSHYSRSGARRRARWLKK